MTTLALLMAGAFAFGHGPAADNKPFAASRANAIVEAAKGPAAKAPPPEATTVRYPSADGDILAGLGRSMVVPPLKPARPIAADFDTPKARSATSSGVDASGLLGGPPQ